MHGGWRARRSAGAPGRFLLVFKVWQTFRDTKKRGSAAHMTILFYLIVVLHVIACLFLIAVVLLQQGKGQDLASAFGGGGTQTAFGPRGSATVLSRATTILAGLFMVTSLALTIVRPQASGVLDSVPEATTSPSPAATAAPVTTPAAPQSSLPAEAPAAAPSAAPSPAAK
jgi:preprotein translocase subunit SecG